MIENVIIIIVVIIAVYFTARKLLAQIKGDNCEQCSCMMKKQAQDLFLPNNSPAEKSKEQIS